MQIFIMRHGQASDWGQSDAQRALTEHGVQEAEAMGKWMEQQKISPNLIWVSPYLRAEQTYQAMLPTLAVTAQHQTQAMITPSGAARTVHDLIDGELATGHIDQLLLVSHMPLVSYLVAELTHETQTPIFQTASIVEIDYDIETMTGRFVQMISPSDLID
ncbi:phosphohistidine phosphatase SixA [Colwellia sp. MEBiC06753]